MSPEVTPDITGNLPGSLGLYGITSAPAPSGWDVTFGSLGFLLDPVATPYQRASEQTRKQQIDTSREAGEQSLSNWWTRSQDTWDRGAGIRWYEPEAEPETADRFASSYGVDIWTPGQFSLLKRTDAVSIAAGSGGWICSFDLPDQAGYCEFRGETARRYVTGGIDSTATTGTSGTNFSQPVIVGSHAYAGGVNGVWKFDPVADTLTKVLTTAAPARVWWAKHRLVVAVGSTLYTVPLGYTPGDPVTTAGTAVDSIVSSAWVWTDVAETANSILVSGYDGRDSAIFRIPLQPQDDGTVILGALEQVLRMAPGEVVHCMGVYLGTSMVLGTTYGVRISQVNGAGEVQMGPLSVETSNPAYDVTFRDRFAYVALGPDLPGGTSGAVRVDLSAPTDEQGRFAWAYDASSGSATACNSIALLGERVALVFGASGHVLQSATNYVTQGWLDTGQVRYATAELKAFRYARMATLTRGGTVDLRAVDSAGTERGVVTFDDSYSTTDDCAINILQRPLNQFLSFRVYLSPSAAGTASPVVTGLSIKAVPAAGKIRLFQYPLSVREREQDRWGNRRTGSPYARLRALESLEETGVPVNVVDHRTGESYTGQIDSVEFSSNTPADSTDSGFSGVATVIVRRI
jgi:hypothetical protein